MKRTLLMLIALLACIALSGCGNSANEEKTAENLTIPLSSLSAEPTFWDWNQDGIKMQLIALTDESGTPRVAYNTCQICAGSPYAYFEYQNGLLQCMNCGNLFSLSAVGEASGGCTPLNVGDYSVSDTELTVSQSELKSAASVFANWKKGL